MLVGSLHGRRRGPRRDEDAGFGHIDWHDSRWLAVALLILLLSCADAVFTIMLIGHGATEVNPLMAPLVEAASASFAYWKVGLTCAGVVLLTILVRIRAFGRFPAGYILYAVLLGYSVLVGYEVWLLGRIAGS